MLDDKWENKTLDYNLKKYPWNTWVLSAIKEQFPSTTSLENIHENLKIEELHEVCIYVQDLFKTKLWMERLSSFANEYIPSLIENKDFLIKRQPTLNLVVPDQERIGRRLPFHQGIFYDNGRGQGTIWMPLTDSYESNAMWIISTKESRSLTKKVIKEKWNLEKFEKECLKVAFPVTLSPGQAHLFNQESIHGNINNTTGKTRMAIDWHVLPEGEEYHRRLPGGFFRHPDDYTSLKEQKLVYDNAVCYVSNNHSLSVNWPKNFQRSIIESYLNDVKLKNIGYQFENEFLDHLPILSYLIEQPVTNLVLSSIYALPSDCESILKKALFNEITLHFANERLTVSNDSDISLVNKYRNWGVPKKGKYSWEE